MWGSRSSRAQQSCGYVNMPWLNKGKERTCVNVDVFIAGFPQAQADKRPSCSKYLLLRNICANDSDIGESRGDGIVYRNGMHSRYSNCADMINRAQSYKCEKLRTPKQEVVRQPLTEELWERGHQFWW